MLADTDMKSQLDKEIDKLLEEERVALYESDHVKLAHICKRTTQLFFDHKEYARLREMILIHTKRRGQAKKAIIEMVQQAMTYLDKIKGDDRYKLLETIIEACEGKLFLEVEFARSTRMLCEMKEERGNIEDACSTIQDVQVETYGSMDKKEKVDYILYQISLMLKKKDYVRTQLIGKKINRKHLNEAGFEELKIRYYTQMVQYYSHEKMHLDVAKSYQTIFDTLREKQMFDNLEEKKLKQASFENFVFYLIISPYTNEQVNLLNIVNTLYIKELEANPVLLKFVKKFLTDELMVMNANEIRQEIGGFGPFAAPTEHYPENHELFIKQIIQHNLRVVEKYYSRLRLARLAELLGVASDRVESEIADMVCRKILIAKINRLEGIVYFSPPKDENKVLNEWNHDLKTLLEKVEETCHLINRENIIHQ